MTILPNLDILIAQRRGELMLYKNSDKSCKTGWLFKCVLEIEYTKV